MAGIERTCAFYTRVPGMKIEIFAGRTALRFGAQKINLHAKGHEFEPKAAAPTPGSADLCLIACASVGDIATRLRTLGVAIVEGSAERAGAAGPLRSIYIRDPDGDLIEISDVAAPPRSLRHE